jgi:hypothetical protein
LLATGTPPRLTTDADGVRRQRTGPFISVRVVSGRHTDAKAGESDRAAREHEDQEEQEPDQVERKPEVGDDSAEAERLHEQERAGRNGDPAKPARQHAGCEHEQTASEHEEAAEHVADAVEREREQVEGVGEAVFLLGRVGRYLAGEQAVDADVADAVERDEQHSADQHP